jgi:hypothetical protein
LRQYGGAGRGGLKERPGDASLTHHGVLFLDELPEFHGIRQQTHLLSSGRRRRSYQVQIVGP